MKRTRNLVVLMGGPSSEYAISLKSGQGVVEALLRRGWQPKPLVIPQDLSIDDALDWTREALAHFDVDVIFLALHGTFGEDGTIQQLCEELQVAYTGSDVTASRLGIDKVASRQRFIDAGLQVPQWQAVVPGSGTVVDVGRLRCPLIVKPSNQGSSIGVSKVMRLRDLGMALHHAGRYSKTVIVEEYIPGREVTVSVLGKRALPVVEIVPKHAWFDFSSKYTTGLTDYHVPADLPPAASRAVQQAGLCAHQAIGARHFSRADMILSQAQIPVVLEVNTIPGFTPTSLVPKAAASMGISYDELCEQLVEMAWKTSQRPLSVGAGSNQV